MQTTASGQRSQLACTSERDSAAPKRKRVDADSSINRSRRKARRGSAVGHRRERLFVRESDALLEGSIDVDVHSSKEMTVMLPRARGCRALEREEDSSGGAGGRRRDGVALRRGDGGAYRQSARVGKRSVRRSAKISRSSPAVINIGGQPRKRDTKRTPESSTRLSAARLKRPAGRTGFRPD